MTGTVRREPLIDVVRAVAMCGVVVGHWLVTAPVAGDGGVLADLRLESPLRQLPELTPLSWLLQTLGLFFLAGGFASAGSHRRAVERGEPLGRWYVARFRRLAVAVVIVLGTWSVVLGMLGWLAGLRWSAAAVVVNLVTSPLWFLAVYLVLLGGTGLARRLHARAGVAAVGLPIMLSVLVEAVVAVGAPDVIGYLTLVLVWWTPWQLGVALAEGWRPRWPQSALLLAAGVTAMVLLVLVWGYPASAVGGTAARSNLNPPSLFALALALAQVGAVLVVAKPLRAVAAWRGWRAAVAWVNERVLPIFLLHQSALVTVVLLTGAAGPLPGLQAPPSELDWVLVRLAWMPLFALVLLVLLAGLRALTGRRAS